jgi:hypothetical protein
LQEATINTNSYAADQGRCGASQVNYFTKSGSNHFHGDVYEIWNGSLLNATDYFLHANDTPGNIAKKPRSTVNEFGVSVGGPILKDKLFFFGHYEGIRIALPFVARTTVPSPAYQQYFALPSNQAGAPGKSATQTGFGALTSTISPPTVLLGVGLGGDRSPPMIAFQGRIEF